MRSPGGPASFSWRELVNRQGADRRASCADSSRSSRSSISPRWSRASAATKAIRQAVSDLKLDTEYRARVRLTGPIPIQDEEFGTLKEHSEINTARLARDS